MEDPRRAAAKFYDLDPSFPDDVPFYLARVPSRTARVLELGSGTGRVTVPLAHRCGFLRGIDHSPAMVELCRAKLLTAGLERRARVEVGDITDFDLGTEFDFIIAPYRVLQNLETDRQVQGLFRGIREHLSAGGRCILNAFRTNRSLEELRERWHTREETLDWEVPVEGGKVACYGRRTGMIVDPLVLKPELVYRRFEGEELAEEALLSFVMRCYYPDELLARIRAEGFTITATFGGYAGEIYGEGNELVVEFTTT